MPVHHTLLLAASVVFSAAITAYAQAANASRWDGDHRAAVRLVAGTALSEQGARLLRGGIQVKLGPTWKMYWRYAGDAGIPPRFDFAASENVKAITVLWPAPQRFSQDGLNLIVYKGEVTLPLRVTPVDRASQRSFASSLTTEFARLCVSGLKPKANWSFQEARAPMIVRSLPRTSECQNQSRSGKGGRWRFAPFGTKLDRACLG